MCGMDGTGIMMHAHTGADGDGDGAMENGKEERKMVSLSFSLYRTRDAKLSSKQERPRRSVIVIEERAK